MTHATEVTLHTIQNSAQQKALDGPALQQATLATWHQQTHLRAGLQRVVQAQLRLPHKPRSTNFLHTLAQRLANGGAAVDVLVVPGLAQAQLRLEWAAWHAPPLSSTAQPPSQLQPQPQQ